MRAGVIGCCLVSLTFIFSLCLCFHCNSQGYLSSGLGSWGHSVALRDLWTVSQVLTHWLWSPGGTSAA